MKRLNILSLGAGVQSSTLAFLSAHDLIPRYDAAIFADTGNELPEVLSWLDWMETRLPFPVYRVSAGTLSDSALTVKLSAKGNFYHKSTPPAFIVDSDKRRGVMIRQCTQDFKLRPILAKLREMGGKQSGVLQSIGISLDEVIRVKPSRHSWIENIWPLLDLRMTRHDCIRWMQSNGYPIPPRSSCTICPFHSDNEWHKLKNENPADFEFAVAFEGKFQDAMSRVKGFRGTPYLHHSLKPLHSVDFQPNKNQADLFGNECSGLCGV